MKINWKKSAFAVAVIPVVLTGCSAAAAPSNSTSATNSTNQTNTASYGMNMAQKEDNQPPRVYTMNEISNTVSVVDPATNTLLTTIPLGDEDIHRPLYNGFIDVHGAWLSPNGKILLVTARGSSDVIKIDTETNKVTGYLPVGREPHAIMFTNDGKEAWVTIRGENYIDVIDPLTLELKRKIETVNGPGMPVFSNDNKLAFISDQKGDQVDIIDTASGKSVKRLTVGGKFSPFIMTSPDGTEVWVVNKDTSKITVIDVKTLTVKQIFDVGPKPNHVHFIDTPAGHFAYLSVTGNSNSVEVYNAETKKLVTTIKVGTTPHGVMPNADMTKVYVDNEASNDVYVIDTATNQVVGKVGVGKKPIDLIFKP